MQTEDLNKRTCKVIGAREHEFPSGAFNEMRQPEPCTGLEHHAVKSSEALHPPTACLPSPTNQSNVDASRCVERENSGFSVYNNQNKRK